MFKFTKFSSSLLVVGMSLALTPAFFAAGPVLEARWFPVVRDVEVSHDEETREGTSFYVRFRKVRQCEFLALVWYEGPVRLSVDFEPHSDDSPRTRPVGEQYSGPWLVRDLHGIQGSRAHAYHRCHPLWTTITTFYQG
ncbi:hypothetical protein [Roseovarius rhodophyticola]|uniref:Secreted protein n=1 Tax=Roseovarius rhodophyticola TaxID=3080827 RepID=A0ABZ2TJQ9_9RHOB|nr:hypothetical protein [Roseovarius sp. W115]MDV2928591.1 hypothetical protein [Roseovarius sp. W115]